MPRWADAAATRTRDICIRDDSGSRTARSSIIARQDLHLRTCSFMDGAHRRRDRSPGKPDPLSTPTHIMQFARSSRSLGHIGMIGIKTYVLPLTGGENNTACAQVASACRRRRARRRPRGIHASIFARRRILPRRIPRWTDPDSVDVALGGRFYDVAVSIPDSSARQGTPPAQLRLPPARPAARTASRTSGATRRPAPIEHARRSAVAERRVVAGGGSQAWHDRPVDLLDRERTRAGRELRLGESAPSGLGESDRRIHAPVDK